MEWNKYEEIELDDFDGQRKVIFVCCDCGAFAEQKENIKHYETCKPGEAEKREKFCNQPDPDEPPF